jgi:hypothetical protein
MAVRPADPGQSQIGDGAGHQPPAPTFIGRSNLLLVSQRAQPLVTTGPFPIGALPMGALPTTGVGGGGCRVGRSAASAALPVASVDTITHIKCFTSNPPLIVHDVF